MTCRPDLRSWSAETDVARVPDRVVARPSWDAQAVLHGMVGAVVEVETPAERPGLVRPPGRVGRIRPGPSSTSRR
ncbi:hypothetical protein CFP66_02885 [Pseudonocardia sp. MH-G8]|nr:hypothetical protein CFP66_02885 [Pseudonocardia sp. MH-G8]